jgi:CheY-like chemotaxis protein
LLFSTLLLPRIVLPVFTQRNDRSLIMSQPAKKRTYPPEGRRPLIYIVDDEPLLLDLAEASLQPAQYEIKQFQDPELAWRSFLHAQPKPDLLLTDYAMGQMNGLELIQNCKALKPDLKAILISGTAGADILLGAPVRVESFLGKPYQPGTLLELARTVLARGE